MNADASGIKFPEVIPYPMQGLDGLTLGHRYHLFPTDERLAHRQRLAMLLVAHPHHVTSLK